MNETSDQGLWDWVLMPAVRANKPCCSSSSHKLKSMSPDDLHLHVPLAKPLLPAHKTAAGLKQKLKWQKGLKDSSSLQNPWSETASENTARKLSLYVCISLAGAFECLLLVCREMKVLDSIYNREKKRRRGLNGMRGLNSTLQKFRVFGGVSKAYG